MRIKITPALVAAAVLCFAGSAMAQDVRITGVAANGSGCPNGSVVGLVNNSVATLLFDSYTVQGTRQQPFQTRSCSVAIGLTVPAGVAVSLTDFTWMGTMNLGQGSQGAFTRSLFFAGQPAARNLTERYFGGFTPIDLTDTVGGLTVTFCDSTDTIARANTSLSVGGQGVGNVQSLDAAVFQRMLLSLSLRAANCGGTIGGDSLNPTPFPGSNGTPAPPRRRGGRRGGRGGFGGFGGGNFFGF